MLKLGRGAIGHFVMLIKIGLHLYLGSILQLDKSQSFGDEIPKTALSPQLFKDLGNDRVIWSSQSLKDSNTQSFVIIYIIFQSESCSSGIEADEPWMSFLSCERPCSL